MYLITEVVYSAGVDMVVSAAGRTKQYFSSRVLPLAFMYQKFPLDQYGALGTEVGNTDYVASKIAARSVVSLSQRMLHIKLRSGKFFRRHRSGVALRYVLTICSR